MATPREAWEAATQHTDQPTAEWADLTRVQRTAWAEWLELTLARLNQQGGRVAAYITANPKI